MIQHDIEQPHARPLTAVGTIVAALDLRRRRGMRPFTILSCDNLPGNGKLSRAMVTGFIRKRNDIELSAWVEAETKFPNCMVDRITPATTPPTSRADPFSDSVRTLARETCGVDDDWPASGLLCHLSVWTFELYSCCLCHYMISSKGNCGNIQSMGYWGHLLYGATIVGRSGGIIRSRCWTIRAHEAQTLECRAFCNRIQCISHRCGEMSFSAWSLNFSQYLDHL